VQHPTADDLTRVPLFTGLDGETRAGLAERFDVEEHAAGKVLVTEGRPGYAFYILASGKAGVSVGDRPIRLLGPGDYFGEMAILGEGRRTATVTAAEPVVVWVLFGTSFRELQTAQPDLADALTRVMNERLD
jgi:CRP-like cAMP-binding protein